VAIFSANDQRSQAGPMTSENQRGVSSGSGCRDWFGQDGAINQ